MVFMPYKIYPKDCPHCRWPTGSELLLASPCCPRRLSCASCLGISRLDLWPLPCPWTLHCQVMPHNWNMKWRSRRGSLGSWCELPPLSWPFLGWTYKANKANKEPVGCDPIMEKPPAPLPSPVPYLLLERQRLINPVSWREASLRFFPPQISRDISQSLKIVPPSLRLKKWMLTCN